MVLKYLCIFLSAIEDVLTYLSFFWEMYYITIYFGRSINFCLDDLILWQEMFILLVFIGFLNPSYKWIRAIGFFWKGKCQSPGDLA